MLNNLSILGSNQYEQLSRRCIVMLKKGRKKCSLQTLRWKTSYITGQICYNKSTTWVNFHYFRNAKIRTCSFCPKTLCITSYFFKVENCYYNDLHFQLRPVQNLWNTKSISRLQTCTSEESNHSWYFLCWKQETRSEPSALEYSQYANIIQFYKAIHFKRIMWLPCRTSWTWHVTCISFNWTQDPPDRDQNCLHSVLRVIICSEGDQLLSNSFLNS